MKYENYEFYQLLGIQVFHDLSKKQWNGLRKDMQLPIYSNKLSTLQKSLLDTNLSCKLCHQRGAYLQLDKHINSVIELYNQNNMFEDTEILTWKLSWDNRRLWGKNKAWTLSPMSVPMSQSSTHTHNIMIANISEKNINLYSAVDESAMQDILVDFDNSNIEFNDKEHCQKLIVCADWNAIVAELNTTPANTHSLDKPVCWQCNANKKWLRTDWLDDPSIIIHPLVRYQIFLTPSSIQYHYLVDDIV